MVKKPSGVVLDVKTISSKFLVVYKRLVLLLSFSDVNVNILASSNEPKLLETILLLPLFISTEQLFIAFI